MQTQIRRRRTRCLWRLIRAHPVFLNCRKLRVNKTHSAQFFQRSRIDNRPTSAVSALIFIMWRLILFKLFFFPLRKHAYSNILKILPPKNENFQIKNSDIFHISAQNIDCEYSLETPRRGGSNEYPQSMFFSKIRQNNLYPCKPQFYYIKVGFKGGQNYIGGFS